MIFSDVFFVYRHFLHWNISKIILSCYSFVLAIILALPFFILVVLLGMFDPLDWISIFSDSNISHELLTQTLASHPYWLIAMIFLGATTVLVFLMAGAYFSVLQSRLSQKYIERKLLAYKKNIRINFKEIQTFFGIISWMSLYLLAPFIIWGGGVFYLYLMYHSEMLSFSFLSYSLLASTVLLIVALMYLSYRMCFSYIILAEEGDEIHKSRHYIKKSFQLSKGKNMWKFLFISILYFLLISPIRISENYLEQSSQAMRDALAFKTKTIENIDADDMPYYEYITKEYKDVSEEALIDTVVLYTRLRIVLFFAFYLLFTGLFVVLLTSFYSRVLQK